MQHRYIIQLSKVQHLHGKILAECSTLEGDRRMKDKKTAFSFVVDREVEEQILALRSREEFRRCTISEIIRRLIAAGLEESKK